MLSHCPLKGIAFCELCQPSHFVARVGCLGPAELIFLSSRLHYKPL